MESVLSGRILTLMRRPTGPRAPRPATLRMPGPGQCLPVRGTDRPSGSLRATARRPIAHHRADRDSQAANARLSAHDGGMKGNAGERFDDGTPVDDVPWRRLVSHITAYPSGIG